MEHVLAYNLIDIIPRSYFATAERIHLMFIVILKEKECYTNLQIIFTKIFKSPTLNHPSFQNSGFFPKYS